MITINKLRLNMHTFTEGLSAILLSSIITLLYSFVDFEIMGFTAGTLFILLLFVTVDFITGTSMSLKSGEKIQSKKGRQTIYKFTGYVMTILLLAVIEIFTHNESGVGFGTISISFLRNFIFSMMLLWEFHSVGENIEGIFGSKPKIFYFVEVTMGMFEKKLINMLENSFKINSVNEKDEISNTEESTEDIPKT